MDPNHEAPQEPFVLPLEQWANLLSLREQTSSEASGAGHRKPPSDVETKSWRQQRTVVVTCMASCIVDLLLKNVLDNDEDVPLSERPPSIEAADISIDNFMVALNLEVDVESLGPNQLSAADIIEKCTLEQIKNAIETEVQVDFASAELRQKRAIDVNEKLEHAFFVNLGQLFYKLFLPKPLSSRDEESDVPNEPAEEKKINDPNEYRDEEEPGAEKGRRKHAIHETCKSFKNVSISAVYDELQQQMLPTSICRLVGDLIETGPSNNFGFETLKDVLLELIQIIENRRVLLSEETLSRKELDFPEDQIFGRTTEITNLLETIRIAREESRQFISNFVLVGGHPGSGKSHLLKTLNEPYTRSGWIYLNCKFDRMSQNQASSTIASAFDDFFRRLADWRLQVGDGVQDRGADAYDMLLASITNNLTGSDIATLSEVMPSLRTLFPGLFQRVVVEDDSISDKSDDDRSRNSRSDNNDLVQEEEDCLAADMYKTRLHYLLKRLVRAITSPQIPALLFVDDLQWADSASLDLISSLLKSSRQFQLMGDVEDEDDPHCLVIAATYRSSEVNEYHLVTSYLKDFVESDVIRVTHFKLDGMEIEGTNAMISHALRLPARLTRELGNAVHMKTLGNPLFVKTFIKSLEMDGLMHYSLEKKRWVWDIKAVKSKSIDDDVASIMTRKVEVMPENVQFALRVLSCFGMQVDGEVLELLSTSDQFRQVLPSLEKAISDGIVLKSESRYSFPHDLILESVYRIGHMSVDRLHFDIGVHILGQIPKGSDAPFGRISFAAIDQINVATSIHVTDPNQRILFASCNLRASNRLVEQANASMALVYAEHGLRYLGGWELNFQLCLQLHETACLACYLNGLANRVSPLVEEILAHAETLMQRMKALFILVKTLGTSGRSEAAVAKAFRVLNQLGVNIPDDVAGTDILAALVSTEELLSNYSREQIIDAPTLHDERRQWQMRWMDLMIPFVHLVSPKYIPIIGCRMVEISLSYGLCRESAFGFLVYGYSCVKVLQNIAEGYLWAKVSMPILERFNAKSLYPKARCLLLGYVSFWVEPFQSTALALSECYEEGLLVGDAEFAQTGAAVSCMQNFSCGKELSVIEKDINAVIPTMVQMNQVQNLFAQMHVLKSVLALTGSNANPFEIAQVPIKNEEDLISASSQRPSLLQLVYFNKLFVDIFFRRFDEALVMLEKYRALSNEVMRFQDIFLVFFQGLIAFHLSRSGDDSSDWLSIGEGSVRQFQSWVENSEWNFPNKLWLLEAEMNFTKGEYDKAEEMYIASIESAHKHRFPHEQGLARELLGAFYISRGNSNDEEREISKAVMCYKEWGAHGLLSEPRFDRFRRC